MLRDIHNLMKVSRVISPTRVTDDTAQVGQIIDNQGYDSLEYVIAIGTLADANATFAVLVEDGDDSALSDNAAVVDGELLGTETEAGFQFDDDDEVRRIGYRGNKRYTRMTITPSGNSGNADISVVAIQMHAHHQPQAASAGS